MDDRLKCSQCENSAWCGQIQSVCKWPEGRINGVIPEGKEMLKMTERPKDLKHSEAFCLMNYRCTKGCCHELIYNSCDQVTPFMISSKLGHEMHHVLWDRDLYDPLHKPCIGERVFVPATRENILEEIQLTVKLSWSNLQDLYETQEKAIEAFVKDHLKSECPALITIK